MERSAAPLLATATRCSLQPPSCPLSERLAIPLERLRTEDIFQDESAVLEKFRGFVRGA
jgi:hypothetical protein